VAASPSIAIAVSGLGRIRRGSETWAVDLAAALHGAGDDVRLYGSARVATPARQKSAWALGRDSFWLRALDYRKRYLVEQRTFFRSVLRELRRDPPDLVHATDPQLAWWLRQAFRERGPKVFYMDGLMLGPDWNWRFDHVQVLAPYYLESAKAAGRDTTGWRVIPHFIDPSPFMHDELRPADRRRLLPGVPGDKPVALAVGDFAAGSSKRLDHVVRELASLRASERPHLVLVGNATAAERDAMARLAGEALGSGATIHTSLRREEMAAVYRCADFFVHAALKEPFGIVLLEAMASGLPVLGHTFPVTAWIAGDGGETVDMEGAGILADSVAGWLRDPDRIARAGRRARARVAATFSSLTVVPEYRRAYAGIAATGG
jgi:glycosyltransferase involved in cell wall biosynthesis